MQYDKYYNQMLEFILSREGGYVNNSIDKGGETNKGITHTTYNSYRKSKGLTQQSVKYITNDELQEIYYKNYYLASNADKIENPRLALYVFDTAVNMGVSVAKELLNKSNGNLDTYEKLRLEKYQQYIKYDKSQQMFFNGWKNRIKHLRDFAENTLPESKTPIFNIEIKMNTDKNGNILYYYNIDDLRKMNIKELRKHLPKIFQQIINNNILQKYKNNTQSTNCIGTYKVNGYIRSNGVKVSSYERTCGAKHMGKQSVLEKYFGLRYQDLSETELNEVLEELV